MIIKEIQSTKHLPWSTLLMFILYIPLCHIMLKQLIHFLTPIVNFKNLILGPHLYLYIRIIFIYSNIL